MDGYNGYLFEPGNAEAMAEKIRPLDDDEKTKSFGENSKKQLEERFSQKEHYKKLIELFYQVKK